MTDSDGSRTALLLGGSESLHVRAAQVLEGEGFFVFAAATSEEALSLAAVLPEIELLVVAPGIADGATVMELIALCDELPGTRVIVMVDGGRGVHAVSDIRTLPADFSPTMLRALIQ